MEYERANINFNGNIFHSRSHRIQRNNSPVCRKLHCCSYCLLIFGIFLLFAGIIMTCVSYIHPTSFDDAFFEEIDQFRIVGPILLIFGIFFFISAIALVCATKNFMKKNNANNFLQNFAVSAPPPPPSLLLQSNLFDIHHNLNNISGNNHPYHQSQTFEQPPPPYDSLK